MRLAKIVDQARIGGSPVDRSVSSHTQERQVDFRTWLSITWADVVAHPHPEEHRKHRLAGTGVDYAEGVKLTDPRRMAIYFAKYGTAGGKEYQHRVPREWMSGVLVCDDCAAEYDLELDDCPTCGSLDAELVDAGAGPGRFWGYRGLRPVLAIRQVTPIVGIQAGRVMRRWYRSKRLTKQITVERVEQATGTRLHPKIPCPQTVVRAQPQLRHRQRRAGVRLPSRPLPGFASGIKACANRYSTSVR